MSRPSTNNKISADGHFEEAGREPKQDGHWADCTTIVLPWEYCCKQWHCGLIFIIYYYYLFIYLLFIFIIYLYLLFIIYLFLLFIYLLFIIYLFIYLFIHSLLVICIVLTCLELWHIQTHLFVITTFLLKYMEGITWIL